MIEKPKCVHYIYILTWHRVADGRDEGLPIVSKSGAPLEEKAVIPGVPAARFAAVGDEEMAERFGRRRC